VLAVDTNILIYAADTRSPFHKPCRIWLERQRELPDAWYSTWPILYEFLRVTTHPRVMPKPWSLATAWQFVLGLLEAPGFDVLAPTSRHAAVASELIDEMPHLAGNIVHDVHTAVLLREHGIRRICTRDTDFHQFGFLEVIDPLRL
jgi:toxin-antitoxin system PIN domain toxin